MKDALAIHRWLLAHQVHHEIVRLPRPMTCAEELPETVSAAPERCLMVTVLEVATRSGREVVVGVTSPVSLPPRPGVVGGLLGARQVRPASSRVVNAATDYADGLVCPLLLPESLPVFVDDRLTTGPEPIFMPTGERHTALAVRGLDLLTLLPGKIVDLRGSRPRGARGAVARRH
ncbi:Cys-tRNA(Pro) deacylase, prolyl-tRNA editing enzyme YbaK/EbsC [Nonomuraea maritima]|uniref:Cys-tRNA(Pro) deacylase, prolyl-tRNA editing enzyme YbaK/EbsC n=1 Tax=Nonomuraea maritima TaxID=683260 RepID=A0A1G9KUK5_9ACTN|nr:YbaK/EbsC family protein [Nonomuraea maritima]SDL52985.1 Cys-tRNA(Pro) deacylase, prolyl-tRNA editing enzyme YbaK/EbsC [Nonomuraea maritima]